ETIEKRTGRKIPDSVRKDGTLYLQMGDDLLFADGKGGMALLSRWENEGERFESDEDVTAGRTIVRANGEELARWEPAGEGAERHLEGRYHGHNFTLEPGELATIAKDGSRLNIADEKSPDQVKGYIDAKLGAR